MRIERFINRLSGDPNNDISDMINIIQKTVKIKIGESIRESIIAKSSSLMDEIFEDEEDDVKASKYVQVFEEVNLEDRSLQSDNKTEI